MNKQGKINSDGKIEGRINWTKTILPNGTEVRGATWNVGGGCKHGCRWRMPDGAVVKCYAEETAEGIAAQHYPFGFGTHYWHPQRLDEPLRATTPQRIFLDSMWDICGHWVPAAHVQAVIDICRQADWHTFQILTKNPKRYIEFDWPENCWLGFSTPPDFMNGHELSQAQKQRKLDSDLAAMRNLRGQFEGVLWCSAEPLSWNVADAFSDCPLDWVVIGAGSDGRTVYQPEPAITQALIDVLDRQGIAIFMKSDLEWSPHREVFPVVK